MQDTTAPSLTGASATPDPVELGASVHLGVQATDLGGVSSVTVDILGPNGYSMVNASLPAGAGNSYGRSFVMDSVATYAYTITAVDASGNARTVSGSFVVQDTAAPVASAGPDQSVVQGTTVTFDGSASTDNDAVANCTWTFSDAGTQTLAGAAPTYTFSRAGTFVVMLTVKDPSGNTATDTMTVTVTALPPSTGSITGTVRDAAGAPIAGATVDLISGTTKLGSTTTDAQGHFAFANVAAGTYDVVAYKSGYDAGSAQVTVVGGQTATASVHLNIVPVPPPPAGTDWLVILAILGAVVAAAAVAGFLILRRRKG